MTSDTVDRVVKLLARLPGLGPRSARRATLHLLKRRDSLLPSLLDALGHLSADVVACEQCGNLDVETPCALCRDPARETGTLCVVEEVDDLWAMERSGAYRGRYHVLGGTLSAIDGVGPDELHIPELLRRIERAQPPITEVVVALGATVEGQTTAHYVADRLAPFGLTITRLGHGVPLGGQLTYLDDGTIDAALRARRPLG
ncbi:MAG: recombination mediator RecR [Pseudomonadota bacterium]